MWLVHDIITTLIMSKSVSGMKRNERSVRDIAPDKQTKKQSPQPGDGNSEPPRRSRDKRAATYGMWFIGLVILLLLFFSFSTLFAKTTVTVTPRTAPISVDDTFRAQPPNTTGTSSSQTLTYSVVSVSDTVSRVASSSGSEYREQQAEGEITIYNEYSDEGINLVPNTRFESPDGNIYRTRSGVTVPGREDGSAGQITVPVVAAEVGESYNVSGDVRFSVPGFDGTPQEGQVYAELSSPITGGIAREVPVVGTSTRQQVADTVSESLRQQLTGDIQEEIPEGMIAYPDARFYTTETNLRSEGQSQAEVSVTGQLQAVGFDRRELSIFLANNSGIDATADTNLRVQDLQSFDFAVTNKSEFTPEGEEPLEFQLAGESLVVWQYNKQALARDLQSLQRNQINEVLGNYPSIQSATVNTRPFWKRSLPTDPSAIIITTELDEQE